jgi:hypothetical protein
MGDRIDVSGHLSNLCLGALINFTRRKMYINTEQTTTLQPACEQGMVCLPDRDARIAELAYYKAEQRSFAPGHDLDDWLAAEQEFSMGNNKNPRPTIKVIDDRGGVAQKS